MVAEDRKHDILDVEDHKKVTIIVDGTPHEWPEEYISYAQVVTLEVPDYPQHPEITYTVRYRTAPAASPRARSLRAAPSRSEKE